jgi:tol-pal system protein YbgF
MARGAVRAWAALAAWAVAAPVLADGEGAPVVTIPTQAAPTSLEARVSKLERVVEGQALADLLERIQRLQEDVQRLRGDLEVQNNQLDGLKQRQRDLYLDIDRRLRQLETSASATQAPAPSASSTTPPAVPVVPSFTPPAATAAPAPNAQSEQAAYQKAFDLLKAGHYDEAIAAFHDMLSAYPNGKLADNAQYWMGEADFAARRFREAGDEFSKVINGYPQSPKVPDALLKLGFSYYELGDWANARQTLEKLTARYPQSTAAQLANGRLRKMKSEGH